MKRLAQNEGVSFENFNATMAGNLPARLLFVFVVCRACWNLLLLAWGKLAVFSFSVYFITNSPLNLTVHTSF